MYVAPILSTVCFTRSRWQAAPIRSRCPLCVCLSYMSYNTLTTVETTLIAFSPLYLKDACRDR